MLLSEDIEDRVRSCCDRSQVQKSAVRVSGDWSEHVSSSGKRYYYNCRSEVSQWERPKDWSDAYVLLSTPRTLTITITLLQQLSQRGVGPSTRMSTSLYICRT